MHSEQGYLRVPSSCKFEFLISQPSGLSSVELCEFVPPQKLKKSRDDEGSESEEAIEFAFFVDSFVRAPSAKKPLVTSWKRVFKLVSASEMECKFFMSTENTPEMTLHLSSTLYKQPN